MVLHSLQSLLGRLYDVELHYDVYDFLVTDRRTVAGCVPDNDRAGVRGRIAAGGDRRRRGCRACTWIPRFCAAWKPPIRIGH